MPGLRASLMGGLLLALTGCNTVPRDSSSAALDWSNGDETTQEPVTPPPPEVNLATSSIQVDSAPRATEWVADTWLPLSRWASAAHLGAPKRVGAGPLSVNVPLQQGEIVFSAFSRIARWDGLELHLGFSAREHAGELLVHSLDARKTLEPLAAGAHAFRSPGERIAVVDAGHGGEDSGAHSIFGRRLEKDLTLDWAQRLQGALKAQGWQVYLTRNQDQDLALSNRVAFAEQCRATVFVSLHFNSATPAQTQSGIETYCLAPVGMPSTLTRNFPDDLNAGYENNRFDAENISVACSVHRELLRVPGTRDRGVRRARFMTVLRGQKRPAILIEGGYLSNPAEARLINDPAHRQKLAEAVASGLTQCFGPGQLAARTDKGAPEVLGQSEQGGR